MFSFSPTFACSVPVSVLRPAGSDSLPPAGLIETTRAARESGGPALVRACCAHADHLLGRGKPRAASERLLEALVAVARLDDPHLEVEVERRDAWVACCLGEAGADARLEQTWRRAHELENGDAPVLDLYVAYNRARAGQENVQELVKRGLRALKADTERLPRMMLFASLVYQALDLQDEALITALRVRAAAARSGQRDLLELAGVVLERLQGTQASDARVHHLVSVAIEVGRKRDLGEVFLAVANSALTLLDAERAFVVRGAAQGFEVVAAVARQSGPVGAPSTSIVTRTLQHGTEVISADIDQRFAGSSSVVSLGLRYALCVPMMDGPDVIGAIYADSTTQGRDELTGAAWLIRAFAGHAVAAVRNVELHEQHRQQVRRGRELNHDLRNLISTLQNGLREVAEDAVLEPWAQDVLHSLGDVTDLMKREVADALDGKRASLEQVDLGALLNRCAAFMGHEARKAAVELTVEAVPEVVFARDGDLARVLCNLIGNALKYAPPRTGVWLRVRRVGAEVRVSVEDRGPGIPPQDLERIFTSGFQAEGHRVGRGLGLGFCQRVVDELGGRIHAENLDRGARFVVSLPTSD